MKSSDDATRFVEHGTIGMDYPDSPSHGQQLDGPTAEGDWLQSGELNRHLPGADELEHKWVCSMGWRGGAVGMTPPCWTHWSIWSRWHAEREEGGVQMACWPEDLPVLCWVS